MRPRPSLNALRAFEATARLRSMTAASLELSVRAGIGSGCVWQCTIKNKSTLLRVRRDSCGRCPGTDPAQQLLVLFGRQAHRLQPHRGVIGIAGAHRKGHQRAESSLCRRRDGEAQIPVG